MLVRASWWQEGERWSPGEVLALFPGNQSRQKGKVLWLAGQVSGGVLLGWSVVPPSALLSNVGTWHSWRPSSSPPATLLTLGIFQIFGLSLTETKKIFQKMKYFLNEIKIFPEKGEFFFFLKWHLPGHVFPVLGADSVGAKLYTMATHKVLFTAMSEQLSEPWRYTRSRPSVTFYNLQFLLLISPTCSIKHDKIHKVYCYCMNLKDRFLTCFQAEEKVVDF